MKGQLAAKRRFVNKEQDYTYVGQKDEARPTEKWEKKAKSDTTFGFCGVTQI